MIEQNYVLNLIPFSQFFHRNVRTPTVTLSQYDRESRKIIFELRQDNLPYTIPSGATAALFATKPDKTNLAYAMEVEDEHHVSILLPQQISTVMGEFPAEVVLYDSHGVRLGSANFFFLIERTAANEEGMASEDDIPIFTEYIAQAAAQASISEEYASASAGSAAQAAESATAAEQSATDAAGSAQVAEQSEELAREHATSAENAADAAADSATESKSWAVGGTNTREFEDYDNSKYYSELARQGAGRAGWVDFYIDDDGYLWYRKTPNTELEFLIGDDGYLYVKLGAV